MAEAPIEALVGLMCLVRQARDLEEGEERVRLVERKGQEARGWLMQVIKFSHALNVKKKRSEDPCDVAFSSIANDWTREILQFFVGEEKSIDTRTSEFVKSLLDSFPKAPKPEPSSDSAIPPALSGHKRGRHSSQDSEDTLELPERLSGESPLKRHKALRKMTFSIMSLEEFKASSSDDLILGTPQTLYRALNAPVQPEESVRDEEEHGEEGENNNKMSDQETSLGEEVEETIKKILVSLNLLDIAPDDSITSSGAPAEDLSSSVEEAHKVLDSITNSASASNERLQMACEKLRFEEWPDGQLSDLVSLFLSPTIGRFHSLIFIQHALFPKVRSLTALVSRRLFECIEETTRLHPQSICEALLIPLLTHVPSPQETTTNYGTFQSELLKRLLQNTFLQHFPSMIVPFFG